jgi:hypothetical protein
VHPRRIAFDIAGDSGGDIFAVVKVFFTGCFYRMSLSEEEVLRYSYLSLKELLSRKELLSHAQKWAERIINIAERIISLSFIVLRFLS